MTKICCISDTHGQHWDLEIPKCDVLIHAGDWSTHGKIIDLIDFSDWCNSLKHVETIIVIAGNHDLFAYECSDIAKSVFSDKVQYLENQQTVTPQGLTVWGSPITPTFGDWAFMCDRDKIKRYWDMIPKDINILITHGPAYGVMDDVLCSRFNPKLGSIRVGCEELKRTVRDIAPQLHVFGHIHGGYGIKVGKTTSINASVLNEEYTLVNKPIVVEV